jgi:hypothetical protein
VVSGDNQDLRVQTEQTGEGFVKFLDCLDFSREVAVFPSGIGVLKMDKEEVVFGRVAV